MSSILPTGILVIHHPFPISVIVIGLFNIQQLWGDLSKLQLRTNGAGIDSSYLLVPVFILFGRSQKNRRID